MNKRYLIKTYGCQMNVHESEKIAGQLQTLGYEETQTAEDADVIVFNTCCVRENAEQHAFGNIGMYKKLKKEKKDLVIAVCGCMTQQGEFAKKLSATFPFVDVIIGTYNIDEFGKILQKTVDTKKRVVEILDKNGDICEEITPYRSSYPNAWVNIAYGCNNFCTYCIVPYVRGRERSRLPENVVDEVKNLVNEGYKEITLLGQNVNSYGHDLKNDVGFASLLDEIGKIEGKFRLRFMSNHPKDLTEDVIEAIKRNPHACHAIHLPVQSGSNRILSLMNRRYSVEKYLSQIESIRKIIPDCAITTDIIVGFPTETEEDFIDTVKLVETVKFDGAFTFVYSKREGTKAAIMDGQIDPEIQKDRIMRLIDVQNELNRKESLTYVGKTVEILVEDFDEKKNSYMGRDERGKMAYFSCDENVIGKFVNVKITSAGGMSLMGEIIEIL
ncbi:MAG: tRNA (N6-isopentenyl adenosine(37)-C2)-methylthiotransferase MiaB [Candidatus Borkfalkiaceae bacterium]|nr:tRNA (N6-isopentenyl adenosine(37)-C2)-methylthiotransferase MiaB [Christensenellaceae bacterium]